MSNAALSRALGVLSVILGSIVIACLPISTDPTPFPAAGVTAAPELRDMQTEPAGEKPAPTPTEPNPPTLAPPDLGPAPDFTNEVWINAETKLALEALRGKVVLVEFWTYG